MQVMFFHEIIFARFGRINTAKSLSLHLYFVTFAKA